MKRRTIAFLMILLFLLHISSLAGLAFADGLHNPGLLQKVSLELKNSHTPFALVMDPMSGEYASIGVESVESAILHHNRILITYMANGLARQGYYVEPDLLKYAEGSSVAPIAKNAMAEGSDIGLNRLRELVQNKNGAVVVAVLDTGINMDHPLFAGRLFSPYDVVQKDTIPQDITGHGTHVAGIIAANTPSQVKLMPVRVFHENGGASDYLIVKGIEYAVKNGADVINLSLGGYGTTSYLEKAIDYAYAKGVMVITSAGNEAHDMSHDYPAAFPEVITVGATGRDGDILYFSNTGSELDICAPGEKIESAATGNTYGVKSGTSMAAPLVSSAAAMLLLEDLTRTPEIIEKILITHTRDLGAFGRDPVFGWGELAIGNYLSDPDFYIITSPRERITNEEKNTLNLSFNVSDRVRALDIRIDGILQQTDLVSKPGKMEALLNIRRLEPGTHTLEIQPYLKDNTPLKPYVRSFIVPAYNVRIGLYDVMDQPITNAELLILGTSKMDGRIEKIQANAVWQNGVWMSNLDFQQLSSRYSKIICDVASYPANQANAPLYIRSLGVAGQKTYETSECNLMSIASEDAGIAEGVVAVTRMIGEAFEGFDSESVWRKDPNVYAISTGTTKIGMVVYEAYGSNYYAGLLFYDTADLWLEIQSVRQTGSYPAAWYRFGFLDEMKGEKEIEVSTNPALKLETNAAITYPAVFSMIDAGNDKQIFGEFSPSQAPLQIPPGNYSLQIEPRRTLPDGRKAWDFYRSGIKLMQPGETLKSFGGGLKDNICYDASQQVILHQWVDNYGFSYNVRTEMQPGSGTYQAVLPKMILKDVSSGKGITIDTANLTEAYNGFDHGFRINTVPDGTYGVTFTVDQGVMAYPVENTMETVIIKNGSVVNPSNTSPRMISDYLSYVNPGSLFIYDLNAEFSDNEQDKLHFTASKGWIIEDIFYYRDLVGEDTSIAISAYDGAGGSASFTHTIQITDRMEGEPEYRPIAEIDSIGASSWAVPFIMNAITTDIAPLRLLDLYQNSINREELSELIVKTVEKLRGPIRISPDISFVDTDSEAILKAASLKILSGYNGIFSPYEELSRQQMCVILYQAIKAVKPYKATKITNGPQFKDAAAIAPWAKEAVDFCYAREIMVGSGGIANPTGKLSREQAILMVYKTFVYLR